MPKLLEVFNKLPERGLENFLRIEEEVKCHWSLPNRFIKMCFFLQALFQASPQNLQIPDSIQEIKNLPYNPGQSLLAIFPVDNTWGTLPPSLHLVPSTWREHGLLTGQAEPMTFRGFFLCLSDRNDNFFFLISHYIPNKKLTTRKCIIGGSNLWLLCLILHSC